MITLPIFRRPSKTPCHLTHTSQPNHPAFQVPQFTLKLFAISWKLGFTSGIRELIDAQFYGNFHLCKVRRSRLKTLLRSVWWGGNVDEKVSTMLKFIFQKWLWNNAHSIIFIIWQLLQCGQIAKILRLALTVASHDNNLVLHARCMCRTFVFIVVWCIPMQADRSCEAVKHFHNCI